MRRLRIVLVGMAVAICAASCGDSEPVASAPSTSTPATTVPLVSLTSSTVTSSTVPPTTAAVSTVPPTTTVPVINVEGEPGQPVDVRVKVPTPLSVPDPYPLWMSQTGDSGVVLGYVGLATFESDSLHLVGSIPTVVTHTASHGRWEPATARATTAGDYKISLGPATVVIRVSRDAPAYVAAVSQPSPVPPDRQLLGDGDLAGVAFGTPDADAEQRLIAIFGPPLKAGPWSDTCASQFRDLVWPALRAQFRRLNPQSPGQFTQYSYTTFDRGLPPIEQRLATPTNVTLGVTAAELRGAAGNGFFRATSLGGGPPFDGWTVPGTQLIAILDRDFLDPDARVRAIASPIGAALADC